jgi:hypothetical protein
MLKILATAVACFAMAGFTPAFGQGKSAEAPGKQFDKPVNEDVNDGQRAAYICEQWHGGTFIPGVDDEEGFCDKSEESTEE